MKHIDPKRILYEDEDLLVVNKLEGELTVLAGGEGKLPLFDFLRRHYPGLRVVHRLDFGTSGVLVFAKTSSAVEALRLSHPQWVKKYRALVTGRMEHLKGDITVPLPARTQKDLVPAISHYHVLKRYKTASFVEVQIDTGRKHQVRRHLQSIGHPLLFDPLYGDRRRDAGFRRFHRYSRFFLHASFLSFPHPRTGKILSLSAPLPGAFERVLNELESTE